MNMGMKGMLLMLASLPLPALAAELVLAGSALPPLQVPTGTRISGGHDPALAPAVQGSARAPAAPLSRVVVAGVGSSQAGGWEYMTTPGQLSTVQDHGGAELSVVIMEVGYGGSPSASMNGALLPRSAEYKTEPLCLNGGEYTPCGVGQTYAAWLRYYQLDGAQEGNFHYQNTSINAPFNTLGTDIYIR